MKKPLSKRSSPSSLWEALSAAGESSDRFVVDAQARIRLSDLVTGSALYGRGNELCGRSVLVATTSQLTTASALIELDGVARRIVICPPDLPLEHLPSVIDTAAVDGIVSDRPALPALGFGSPRPMYFSPCSRSIEPANCDRSRQLQTEWVLLTSGTTGVPKLVAHTLTSLVGAIEPAGTSTGAVVWSTFYDIRRYGGLQIFLRAILTGTSLVLSSAQDSATQFLSRLASLGVTHISGTPSHGRRALMSPLAHQIAPEYVRLSGEIADQAILNQLQSVYPQAQITHAFASTEAGVAFEVNDGFAGFPAETLENTPNVDMKIEGDSLRIRSSRTADRYLGSQAPALKDANGFVDTADLLELRDGRYSFVGRRDGVINVGGLKVYPEEIESVINRHPAVQMSLVRTKKNPITGALVVADVVLKEMPPLAGGDARALQNDILLLCREALSSHKVPAAIRFIPSLIVAESGKVLRCNA
jgi:acyl-coenzyme A synthetase/AMP-(fatty) acid ligase